MYTSTKLFREFPNAYRNPQSQTDCYLLHGYCRDFYFVFGSKTLDKQGFVFDFGDLDQIKRWLEEKFDHTVLLQADDPFLDDFLKLQELGVMRVVTLPLVTCEGISEYVGTYVQEWLFDHTSGRAYVIKCECRENGKNSGEWYNPHMLSRPDPSFEDFEQQRRDMVASNVR